MAQKPETTFITKLKKQILATAPGADITKHSNQFVHGIPDLEIILPECPVAITCWFEVKWIPEITNHRKVSYRPLQKEELERRASLGVPCGLIVGSPLGVAWFHGLYLPDVVQKDHFWKIPFNIHMFLDAHHGIQRFPKQEVHHDLGNITLNQSVYPLHVLGKRVRDGEPG